MNISSLVKGTISQFRYYRAGVLYYVVLPEDQREEPFEFTVPIEDTNGATFPNMDKSIFFMRWIRKQLELNKSNQSGAV